MTPPAPARRRLFVAAILAAFTAAVAPLALADLGRWIAGAAVLAAAPVVLGPVWHHPFTRTRILPRLPFLLLGGMATALLWELALGRMPASRDHAIHYYQTWILVDELIPSGRLAGWSLRLNHGYPFGETYPVLAYLVTAAGHLLTFGLMSLRASYALGLLATWCLALWAIGRLAALVHAEIEAVDDTGPRRWLGAPLGAWAAAIGPLLWLLDAGASREGGWNYVMFHGVWPQLLSSALWMASLPLTHGALTQPSGRRLAGATALLGASVLAHPFGLLTAAASGGLWLILMIATRPLGERPLPRLVPFLLVHVGAALLASGWLVTFLASADSMARGPVPWKPLGVLATDAARGELFREHGPWVGPLATLGVVAVLLRGRTLGRLAVGLVVILLTLASDDAITVLRLDLLVSAFKNLQFPRYSLAIKPVWCALGGVGAAVVLGGLARVRPRMETPLRWVLAAILVAPAAVALVDDGSLLVPRPVGAVETLESSAHRDAEAELLAALRAEKAALDPDTPLRVAYLRQGMGGGTYPIITIADAGGELVLDGHVPAVNFKYRVRRTTPKALRALGVTHVIHDRRLGKNRASLKDALEKVDRFGTYTLSRLTPGEPPIRRAKLTDPQGEVAIIADDGMSLTLVAGAFEGPTSLVLDVPPYRKWRVTVDGVPAALEPERVAGEAFSGTRVELAAPATVRLRHVTPSRERAARWLTLLVLVAVGVGLASPRPLPSLAISPSPRVVRVGLVLALIGLIPAGWWVHRRQRTRLATTWEAVDEAVRAPAGAQPTAFVRDLVMADDWWVAHQPADHCSGLLGRDAKAGCSAAGVRPRMRMLFARPYLYRCLEVTLPARGFAQAHFPAGPHEQVVGTLQRRAQSGSGNHLEWRIQNLNEKGKKLGNGRKTFRVDADRVGDGVVVRLRNRSSRLETVCMALGAFVAAPEVEAVVE